MKNLHLAIVAAVVLAMIAPMASADSPIVTFSLGKQTAERHGCASPNADRVMQDFLKKKPRFVHPPAATKGNPVVMILDMPSLTGPDPREVSFPATDYKNGEWLWAMPPNKDTGARVTVKVDLYMVGFCQNPSCSDYDSSLEIKLEQVYKGATCAERWTGWAERSLMFGPAEK